MLTAIVLICSAAITPDIQACNSDNATAVMNVPVQFENAEACFMQGQAYIATTSIGQGLGDNDLVKIVCTRSETTSVTRLRIK
jgi:hypothetical protein